jgi:hypothetical protein
LNDENYTPNTPSPSYTFKLLPEAIWFGVVAVATIVFEMLASGGLEQALEEGETWWKAFGLGLVRAFFGAIFGALTKSAFVGR